MHRQPFRVRTAREAFRALESTRNQKPPSGGLFLWSQVTTFSGATCATENVSARDSGSRFLLPKKYRCAFHNLKISRRGDFLNGCGPERTLHLPWRVVVGLDDSASTTLSSPLRSEAVHSSVQQNSSSRFVDPSGLEPLASSMRMTRSTR